MIHKNSAKSKPLCQKGSLDLLLFPWLNHSPDVAKRLGDCLKYMLEYRVSFRVTDPFLHLSDEEALQLIGAREKYKFLVLNSQPSA